MKQSRARVSFDAKTIQSRKKKSEWKKSRNKGASVHPILPKLLFRKYSLFPRKQKMIAALYERLSLYEVVVKKFQSAILVSVPFYYLLFHYILIYFCTEDFSQLYFVQFYIHTLSYYDQQRHFYSATSFIFYHLYFSCISV